MGGRAKLPHVDQSTNPPTHQSTNPPIHDMKKIVLTFGLISGAIMSAMMLATLPFQDAIGFDKGAIIGYTTMVVAFLLIYFGVRSYRDNVAGGTIRFGRAFAVGALIAGVASLCYVATWEAIYFKLAPDFTAKYQAYELDKARANGESEQAIARRKSEGEKFAKLYNNPAINAAITFLEPLPVALIMVLVTAGVLSRRRTGGTAEGGFASNAPSVT
jgi:hypothetical protein